jgi:hypothetical protein
MGRLLALSLVVVAGLSAGQAPPRAPAGPIQSAGDRPLSPAVVGAWFTSSDAAGSSTLDLFVLWRGSPGWFMKGGGQGSSGGGSSTGRRGLTVKYGGLHLHALFDGPERLAEIDGRKIPLDDHNVVLVDDVDSADGLKVVKTLRVDPSLSDKAKAQPLIVTRDTFACRKTAAGTWENQHRYRSGLDSQTGFTSTGGE